MKIVGILIFNEVEVLDFAGPFEVFSLAETNSKKLFNVITISENNQLLSARNGLIVGSNFQFDNHPKLDIVIIPGGYGAEHIEIKNLKVLNWIKSQVNKVEIIASVCTGAFLLAECGILNNKRATTHWMDLDRLQTQYPKVNIIREVKYVVSEDVITSAGISSGILMSFYIIKLLHGIPKAIEIAKRMEYNLDTKDLLD